jgi:hypothetical protein
MSDPAMVNRVVADKLRAGRATQVTLGELIHADPSLPHDGDLLAQVRDAANDALLAGRHIPLPGGLVAPPGFVWIELENANEVLDQANMPANEVARLEREGIPALDIFGDASGWGLVGPWHGYHLKFHESGMGHFWFDAWGLVARGPNWNRRGVADEDTECGHWNDLAAGEECAHCGAVGTGAGGIMYPWRGP